MQSGKSLPQTSTTVIDPVGNETDLKFSGIYQTQAEFYTGNGGSKSLLKDTYNCYSGNFTSCQTATVSSLASLFAYDNLTDTGLYKVTAQTFDQYGNITGQNDYGFTTGSPTSIRNMQANFNNPALCTTKNICDHPLSIQINNGAGTTQYGLTNYVYDANGNTTSVQRWISGSAYLTTSYHYNSDGTLGTITDPKSTVTTLTYNSSICNGAFPTSVYVPSDAGGNLTTNYIYNCIGGVVSKVTDPNGGVLTTTYSDPYFWRPASTTDPLNNTTYYNYYGVNNSGSSEALSVGKVESVMWNGSSSTIDLLSTPDSLGRPALQQQRETSGPSSQWDTVANVYDSVGHVSWKTLPFQSAAGSGGGSVPGTHYVYDAIGRLIETTDWTNYTDVYTYSLNDVMEVLSVPSGDTPKKKQVEYDALGRLTSVCEISSSLASSVCGQNSPAGANAFNTAYTYDPLGNLVGVSQSGQNRAFTYDGLSRMLSESNPETGNGGATHYSYDSDSTCGASSGDKVKRVDVAGNVTCYAYDALHRVTQITYPSGPNSAATAAKYYSYDIGNPGGISVNNPLGRMTLAITGFGASGTTQEMFSYDERGQITENWDVAITGGNVWNAIAQNYYPNGVLASTALSNAHYFTYTNDYEGRLISAVDDANSTTIWNSAGYNFASQPTTVVFPGGSEGFAYDSNSGRMTQWTSQAGASNTQTGNLTWNASGTLNKLQITDTANSANAQTCNYTYDDLARLSSTACGSTWNYATTFDAFGNIWKTGSFNFNQGYDAYNHVLGYTYDSNGNITYDGANHFAYDAEGRAVTINGIQIYYDAFNRMMTQNSGGIYTNYVYGPAGDRVAILNGSTIQSYFVPLTGGLQAVYTATTLQYYLHKDWLGSTRFASTPGGGVQYDQAYAPYGEAYSVLGTALNNFTGQTKDVTLSAYKFPLREYNAGSGRWFVPDPAGLAAVDIANPQTWNRYAYVGNNPLNATDPLGLYCAVGLGPCGVSGGSYDGAVMGGSTSSGDGFSENYTLDENGNPVDTTSINAGLGDNQPFSGIPTTGSALIRWNISAFQFAPNNIVRMPLPPNALVCSTNIGVNFNAPPGFSVSNIAANGQTNGLWGAGAAVGQGGYYDFQRSQVGSTTQFFPGYTPVANIAVGAYLQGAGVPQWIGSAISNTYAFFKSSNGATAQQAQFRNLGFSLASGKATYSCQSHP